MALLKVHFFSTVLEINTTMNVLLPERPSPRADGKWPSLYLLHGLSGNHTDWLRYSSLERYLFSRDLCVVMPEVGRSFYTDMRHGPKYWTFISEEVPAVCERMFPLSAAREDRFAAGLSMGGYGAFKLGLRCPERFAAVASLSGAVDMVSMYSPEAVAENSIFWSDIFGDIETFRGSEDDLVAVAEALTQSGKPMPRFYMVCGTEDFLYPTNIGFRDRFAGRLPLTFAQMPGTHEWGLWDRTIQDALAFFGV